jgi:D-sedoheptulose 7-phosphate isomerase
MDKITFITDQLKDSSVVMIETIDSCKTALSKAVDLIVASYRNRGKVLLCGNGGSAADAQHLAAELVVRLSHDIKRPGLPAIALTTDTSILTAGGNDIGFTNVFSRQVEALGHPEDVLMVISTSGKSENIIRCLEMAREKQLKSIGFLGSGGGRVADLVTVPVIVPSANTQRVQEVHITLGHILIELIERELFLS